MSSSNVTGFAKRYLFTHKIRPIFWTLKLHNFLFIACNYLKFFHDESYIIWLYFVAKSSLMLWCFVCVYVKCVKKVPFHKSGHILWFILWSEFYTAHWYCYSHSRQHSGPYINQYWWWLYYKCDCTWSQQSTNKVWSFPYRSIAAWFLQTIMHKVYYNYCHVIGHFLTDLDLLGWTNALYAW